MELPRFRAPCLETYSACVVQLRALSVLNLCFRRSTTFAIARRTIPDSQNYFSRQAEVLHSYAKQHITARLSTFRSEFLLLLFNEREHFTIRRMAGSL